MLESRAIAPLLDFGRARAERGSDDRMNRVILHIGNEKAGSSSIQRTLATNSATLLDQEGMFYSRPLGNALWRVVIPAESRDSHSRQIDSILAEASRAGAHTVLCSAELLQSRLTTVEHIAALRSQLEARGFREFQIVVYLRRQSATANSMASTAVQWDKEQLQEPLSEYLDHICDHRKTLTNWTQVFGHQAMTPRLLEPTEFQGGSLQADMLTAINVKRPKRFEISTIRNQQISHTGIEIMRHVNEVLSTSTHTKQLSWKHRRQVRQRIYHSLIERHFTEPKYSQPGYLWRYYDRYYEEGNEWVRRNYFPHRKTLFTYQPPPPQTHPMIDEAVARSVARALVGATLAPPIEFE